MSAMDGCCKAPTIRRSKHASGHNHGFRYRQVGVSGAAGSSSQSRLRFSSAPADQRLQVGHPISRPDCRSRSEAFCSDGNEPPCHCQSLSRSGLKEKAPPRVGGAFPNLGSARCRGRSRTSCTLNTNVSLSRIGNKREIFVPSGEVSTGGFGKEQSPVLRALFKHGRLSGIPDNDRAFSGNLAMHCNTFASGSSDPLAIFPSLSRSSRCNRGCKAPR